MGAAIASQPASCSPAPLSGSVSSDPATPTDYAIGANPDTDVGRILAGLMQSTSQSSEGRRLPEKP